MDKLFNNFVTFSKSKNALMDPYMYVVRKRTSKHILHRWWMEWMVLGDRNIEHVNETLTIIVFSRGEEGGLNYKIIWIPVLRKQ